MRHSLRVDILNNEYSVVVAWGTAKDITTVLHRYHYPKDEVLREEDFECRGLCYWHRGCFPVIALPCFPEDPIEIATLAHEAVHALWHIARITGIDDTEFFAHSVAAIVRGTLTSKRKVLTT